MPGRPCVVRVGQQRKTWVALVVRHLLFVGRPRADSHRRHVRLRQVFTGKQALHRIELIGKESVIMMMPYAMILCYNRRIRPLTTGADN